MPDQVKHAIHRPIDSLLSGLNVLIIEDEHIVALDLDDQLQKMGACLTFICASVAGAKLQLKSQRYDLAILDIKLSDGSGLSLLPILASMAIPVVITSGYPVMDIAKIPFVQKPYTAAILAGAIQQLLGAPMPKKIAGPAVQVCGLLRPS